MSGYITMIYIPSTMLHSFEVEKPKKKLASGPALDKNSSKAFKALAAAPAAFSAKPDLSCLYKY
jgi:hypothetical protein